MQNSNDLCGGCTTVRRREAASWQASPTTKKGFDGFVGFVT